MEKLKELEIKLKDRRTFQLEVLDTVTGAIYQRAINQDYLDENNNGSLPEYLNSLKTKGLQKIQLIQKIKNGNTTKPGGEAVNVDFRSPQETLAEAPAQMQGPAAPGLMGLAASFGLSMPEVMDGWAAKRELEMWKENYRKLETEYKEARERGSKWRERAEKYSRENERFGYKEEIQREPSAIDKLISGIAENPQMIPALIGAFKGGGGLNAPQPAQLAPATEGYTEMQAALCEMIAQCPDNFCEVLANIISRVSEKDKPFEAGLKKLMETNSETE